jgi:malate dehydrogenase (oxaloacetate-decarboxylating)
MNEEKRLLAAKTNPARKKGDLATVLVGADVFIGVSKAGVLTAQMVSTMAAQPIIFALANPIPEIMPEVARQAGALIVATGRSDFPNQVNNVLGFPGLFKGALRNRIAQFTAAMYIRAALNLAALVTPTAEQILPSPFEPGIAEAVARAIDEEASVHRP